MIVDGLRLDPLPGADIEARALTDKPWRCDTDHPASNKLTRIAFTARFAAALRTGPCRTAIYFIDEREREVHPLLVQWIG